MKHWWNNFNFSFPALIAFNVGLVLLLFFSLIRTASAETLLYDTGIDTAHNSLFNQWAGLQLVSSTNIQGRTVTKISLPITRLFDTSQDLTSYMNLGIGIYETSSLDTNITWMATSSFPYMTFPASSSIGWTDIDFGSGLYVPIGYNLYGRMYQGTTTFSSRIYGGLGSPTVDYHKNMTNGGASPWGQAIRIYTNENGITGNETLTLLVPQNSTTTIPAPGSWVTRLTNLNSNFNPYYITVRADFVTSTVPIPSSTVTSWTDQLSFYGSSSTLSFPIPVSYPLTLGNGSYTWTATAKLCGDQLCSFPLATDSNTFIVNLSSTIPHIVGADATTWESNDDFYFNASGKKLTADYVQSYQTGQWCTPSPSSSVFLGIDFFYGTCKTFEFLFAPSPNSLDFLAGSVSMIKGVYPLRYFFDIADTAKAQSLTYANTSTASIAVDFSFMSHGEPLTILSSSTLLNIATPEQKSQIFTVERYVIWLGTLGIIIASTL